ncbi:MAG TPA: hypothetical protein VGM44_19920, partial [Polyangiaceae bacterium]
MALLISACGFPKYEFAASGASGSGGETGGSAGSTAGSATGGSAGSSAGTSGGAGAPTGGVAGDVGMLPACTIAGGGGGGGAGVVSMPAHCSDNKKDGDETDVDCGGPSCRVCYGPTRQACQHDTDCITESCVASTCDPLFELQYEPVNTLASTHTLQFLLRLQFLNPAPQANASLQDIAIRYYFSRVAGDAADPIVPYA